MKTKEQSVFFTPFHAGTSAGVDAGERSVIHILIPHLAHLLIPQPLIRIS